MASTHKVIVEYEGRGSANLTRPLDSVDKRLAKLAKKTEARQKRVASLLRMQEAGPLSNRRERELRRGTAALNSYNTRMGTLLTTQSQMNKSWSDANKRVKDLVPNLSKVQKGFREVARASRM